MDEVCIGPRGHRPLTGNMHRYQVRRFEGLLLTITSAVIGQPCIATFDEVITVTDDPDNKLHVGLLQLAFDPPVLNAPRARIIGTADQKRHGYLSEMLLHCDGLPLELMENLIDIWRTKIAQIVTFTTGRRAGTTDVSVSEYLKAYSAIPSRLIKLSDRRRWLANKLSVEVRSIRRYQQEKDWPK